MSYTINQIALELIRAHGENSSATDTDYVLTTEQWVRDAIDELALQTNWRAFKQVTTLATVASTQVYKLPFNVRDIRYIRDPPTETNLVYLSRERASALNFDLENVSRPQFWGYYDSIIDTVPNPDEPIYEIFFHPVPDAIYTYDIGYMLNPSGLLTGTIIPLLGDQVACIKSQVRAYMCMDDRDYGGAQLWRSIFLQQAQQLKFREHTKYADVPIMGVRDISNRTDRRLARLDPNHFS